MSACTMNLLAAIQLWPLLMVRAVTAVLMASGRSALGITMKGSLPPSSMTAGLMAAPAVPATLRPAPSEPVSDTAFTRSSFRIASTPLLPMRSVWNTPCGNPASVITLSMASAHPGTLLACLSRPTLPAMRAGPINLNTCQYGKFHGITARTTPSG